MKPSSYSVRMDEKIILTMFLFCVFASFVTAFRYKNDKPCETLDFSVTANEYKVDRYISFSAISKRNAEKWKWDFGDKTPTDDTSGPYVTHIYKQAGNFDITLTINGKCTQIKTINIGNILRDTLPNVIPQVIWPPEPILAGQNIMFRDMTSGANRWEWYIGEGKDSKQILTKDAPFTFERPGNYIVKLFVNGNHDTKIEKIIKVNASQRTLPAPQVYAYPPPPIYNPPSDRIDRRGPISIAPPSEKNVIPQKPPTSAEATRITLSEEQFLKMIEGVIEGTVVEQDFALFLCGNTNVRVFYNKEDISFPEAIQNLQNLKKIKSIKALAFANEGTGCIKRISISVKKKGWF